MIRVLVTGPQGSGKTTQAQLLAGFLKVPFIGIGGDLRQRAQQGDEIAGKIKLSLDRGDLVDDKVVADFAKERMAQSDCQNGFVIDGYPRSEEQVKLFNPDYTKVFYLEISDEEVLYRLLARGREDDTPELIKERLRIYHQETEPILKDYQEQGVLEVVDGSLSILQVQDKIRHLINVRQVVNG